MSSRTFSGRSADSAQPFQVRHIMKCIRLRTAVRPTWNVRCPFGSARSIAQPGANHATASSEFSSMPDIQKEELTMELEVELEDCTVGTNRGLSTTAEQARCIEDLCNSLEAMSEPVQLTWMASGHVQCGMDLLSGTWRLLYSSAFLSGSLGGLRPGPPADLAPVKLRSVYQRIDTVSNALDNIVELEAGGPDWLPKLAGAVRVCLAHKFTVIQPSIVRIIYDNFSAELLNPEEPLSLFGQHIQLQPPPLQRLFPEEYRSATFDVCFLNEHMRITRGDKGELRVYVRDNEALGGLGNGLPDPDMNTTFISDSD